MPDDLSYGSVSIVIPTYNRRALLRQTIEGYFHQTSPHLVAEILVVDDASTDETEDTVRDLARQSPFPVRYFRQCKKGPAAARNIGIREARASIVFLTDSDILPKADLIQQHVVWHDRNPQVSIGVLGYVTWEPSVNPTPFMRWYGENKLFEYRRLRNRCMVPPHFLYSCNVSLKTEFLRTHGIFDEEFRTAAYEDTELGYRLGKQGLRLLYNPAAIGYHNQFFSFEQACNKTAANIGALGTFLKKEAGFELRDEMARKRISLGRGFVVALAKMIARGFFPVRCLLDARIPLPDLAYRLFFWESTAIMEAVPCERISRMKGVESSSAS